MQYVPRSEEDKARAITRLVDGTASESERAALESWAAGQPEISREVEQQRRVARELRTGGPPIPPGLLGQVRERARAADYHEVPGTPARHGLSIVGWRAGLAAAAAVVALAVVVGLATNPFGGGTSPSIGAAAQLAFAPSTSPAPGPRTSRLLDVSYAGITYPNYARQFGAVATGKRIDRIGGRPALTVFYRLRDGSRLSYTVFSGKPVPLPDAAKVVVFKGVPLRTFSTKSRLAVVTLVRYGRTCVLAAQTPRDVVLGLAAAPVLAQRV
jgi:anti-sigma factor RsiW